LRKSRKISRKAVVLYCMRWTY